MTVLDTFYLLFKSNAAEARADVKALDQEISQLAAKGDKRDEAENKRLKELRKQRLESTKDLKDQQRVAEETGRAYTKLYESVLKLAAAYVSISALKNGFIETMNLNRQLAIQGELMGQNAQTLKAYGFAFEKLGGSAQDFQAIISKAFKVAGETGQPLGDVDQILKKYREFLKPYKNDPAAFAYMASQLGIDSAAGLRLMRMPDQEFDQFLESVRENAELTKKQAKATEEFAQATQDAAQSMDKLYSVVSESLLPALTALVKFVANSLDYLASKKEAVTAGTKWFTGSWLWQSPLENWLKSKESAAPQANQSSQRTRLGDHKAGMDFWMSQGFTREQAAGIVANEMRESSGNPRAVGDGGKAVGLYQWHPDRRAKILEGTGIDIAIASAEEQRRAALWEMKQMGLDQKMRSAQSADEAAALFSKKFERPANGAMEALVRGKMALQIAESSPFNAMPQSVVNSNNGGNRNSNVKIDQVTVNTQASDARGISAAISQELSTQLRTATSAMDDGVAY